MGYGDKIDFGGDSYFRGGTRRMLGAFRSDAASRDPESVSRDVGGAGLANVLSGSNAMSISAKKPAALASQSFSGGSRPATPQGMVSGLVPGSWANPNYSKMFGVGEDKPSVPGSMQPATDTQPQPKSPVGTLGNVDRLRAFMQTAKSGGIGKMPSALGVDAASTESQIMDKISRGLGDGRFSVVKNNGNSILVNSVTGRPAEYDVAEAIQREQADKMVDDRMAQSRWNEGFGVGDQMNRKRRAEDQAIQSGWNDWYDRRAANDDAVAAQFGVERQDVRDEREREIRLRDEAMRQRIAQEHPDFSAKRAAYNERLADSASRNDDAVAQRHRYERGVPSSPTEAMMFAMANGLRQDPVRSMVAYGSGMDSLGNNEARLRAMKMQNDVANRENDIREVGMRGTLVNQLEDNALRREEFADRRLARDRDSTLSLAKYNPDVIRSSVLSEQQQRVARGEISQQVADAIAQQAYENAIPVWEQIKSFSPGMLENPSRTSATPQFGQMSKATIVPGVPGYGPGGVTGALSADQAKDLFLQLQNKYGDGLNSEIVKNEFRSAGIPITPEMLRDIKDMAFTDNHDGFASYAANHLNLIPLNAFGGVTTNRAVSEARPYADLYKHLSGEDFRPRPKSLLESYGLGW